MRPLRLLLVTAGLLLGVPLAGEGAAGWPPTHPELPVDPALQWGRLENGLRYVIKRQPIPPGAISLRLLVLAGALHEKPAEIGFAHFVEHLAFNDTRRFPRGALAKSLERAGIRFGPDLTAFTWPSHTIYQIDLPANDPERLELGLTVLRDWADGVRFDAKEVKAERAVLIAELQARGEGAERVHRARDQFLHAGTLLAERPVGADAARIRAAQPADLEHFYGEWYRPENIILVAAGDFEPDSMATALSRHFGDMAPRGERRPPLEPGKPQRPPAPTATFVPSREVQTFNAELVYLHPLARADSHAGRRQQLALSLALHALNRRFELLSRDQPERFGQLAALATSPTPYVQELSLRVEGRAPEWASLLATIEQEWRRVLTHGFLETEIEEGRRALRANLDFAARYTTTEAAVHQADQLVGQLVWGAVPTSATFNHALASKMLDEVDVGECVAALAGFTQHGAARLFAYGQMTAPQPDSALLTALAKSAAQTVTAPIGVERAAFAYQDFGPPGEVVRRDHQPDVDIHRVEFANGVRLNLKRTVFEAQSVHLHARLDSGGRLIEPPDRPGLALLAQASLLNGGLRAHDADALRHALAGQTVVLDFSLQERTFVFHGGADTRHLKTLLQLLTAYLSDAALRDSATLAAKQSILGWLEGTQISPDAALSAHTLAILTGGDTRFRPPSIEAIMARRSDEVADWIQSLLAVAPLEVGLVGDFDLEEVIALGASTIGTLPARGPALPTPPVHLRQKGGREKIAVQNSDHRAILLYSWPVEGLDDVRRSRALEVLAWVLRSSLHDRIREELGLSYAIEATYWQSDAAVGQGFLQCTVITDPRNVRRVTRAVQRLAQELQRSGVRLDALERARRPLVDGVEAQLQNNAYWLHYVVSRAQSRPDTLTWPLTRKSDLAGIEAREVNELAREILLSNRLIVISASP